MARPRIRTRASRSPRKQNPSYSKLADAPGGVPISAIVFGGRRRSLAPLVYQARNWPHGVLVGAGCGLGDHRRGHRRGRRRAPRSDGDEAVRRLQLRRLLGALDQRRRASSKSPPQIFHVNWFRQDAPANSCGRATARICACCAGSSIAARATAQARETAIGYLPRPADLDMQGSGHCSRPRSRNCSPCRRRLWHEEFERIGAYLAEFGERVPPALRGGTQATRWPAPER